MDAMGTELLEAAGLREGDSLLLDTSALVALVEDAGPAHKAMEAILKAASTGRIGLRASVLAWTEALRSPRSPEVDIAYRRLLSDSSRIVLVPVDVAVAEAAARILEGSKGRRGFFVDAVHLATALVEGCRAVLTRDEAWREAAPEGLRVLLIDELAFPFSVVE